MSLRATEGRWDLADAPVYFPAAGLAVRGSADVCRWILLNASDLAKEPGFIDWAARERGCRILLDSGVFTIANEASKRKGIPIAEALALPPSEIPGWTPFVEAWKEIVSRSRSALWGYIELDLGGPEIKTRTREGLEGEGFRPIPVHHPLRDGWDYFDYLAERYDRICVANLISVEAPAKLEILREVSERRKGKAVRWIHALGVSPAPSWIVFPTESCDSSSPAGPLRWPSPMLESSAMIPSPIDSMPFRYDCGAERYQAMVRHLYRDADLMGAAAHAHIRAQT